MMHCESQPLPVQLDQPQQLNGYLDKTGLAGLYPHASEFFRPLIDTPIPPIDPVEGNIAMRIEAQVPDESENSELLNRLSDASGQRNIRTAENIHSVRIGVSMAAITGALLHELRHSAPLTRFFGSSFIGFYGGMAVGSKLVEPVVRAVADPIVKRKQQRDINAFLDSELGPHNPDASGWPL